MTTSAETIRHELARRIVNRELAPGVVLDESALAQEFGVSRTPIREALRQLSAAGLVAQSAHRKASVAKPDDEMLAGMFFVMAQLEVLCAGQAALCMEPGQRRALEAWHGDMALLVRQGDAQAFALANEGFHSLIYEGTGNAYLAEVTTATRMRLQAFRRAQFATLGRLAASHREHDAIVQAIVRADKAGAARAMHAHIGHVEESWNRLSQRLEANEKPDAFAAYEAAAAR